MSEFKVFDGAPVVDPDVEWSRARAAFDRGYMLGRAHSWRIGFWTGAALAFLVNALGAAVFWFLRR